MNINHLLSVHRNCMKYNPLVCANSCAFLGVANFQNIPIYVYIYR